MISYEPFYRTLYRKNITEYQLIFKHGVSANTLHRMKHGETITLKTGYPVLYFGLPGVGCD